jgi:23S rRNA (guanine745-N1)-methyltransferase
MAVTSSPASGTPGLSRTAGLVADVWTPLPIRSGITDVVMCVFAPRNAAEFARVLVPGGILVVVTPRESHLHELRASGAMLGIQPDKLAALDGGLAESFVLVDRHALEYSAHLDPQAQLLVAAMGPAGHHERDVVPVDTDDITVAVDLSVFRVR